MSVRIWYDEARMQDDTRANFCANILRHGWEGKECQTTLLWIIRSLHECNTILTNQRRIRWQCGEIYVIGEPILLDSAPLNYVKKSGSKALLKIALISSFLYFPLVYSLCRHSFHSLNLLRYWLNTYQSSRLLISILCLLCFFLSMGFLLCPIQASSNPTCSIDHNNIIHALNTYYIWMVRMYYEYVMLITYATRCYYDDYDLITNSLRHYCRIMTLPIPLRRYFTCNSTRETFQERWRIPRTWRNLVGMQDDIKKNVSDITTNLCELKTMGYIVSS